MRPFACVCGRTVYFLNTRCVGCGHELGYVPERGEMATLERSKGGLRGRTATGWEAALRPCRNWNEHQACNWAVPAGDTHHYCSACRLNTVIPNLSVPGNLKLWRRMESTKRRLLYGLWRLGMPVLGKDEDAAWGLAFAFLADHPDKNTYLESLGGQVRVLTGHANGLITINVAEADDPSREWMRARMEERYRTLLGHFRHETGHYFWDILIRGSDWQAPFDRLFGDSSQDYRKALERHYSRPRGSDGAPGDSHISAYATAHPWEDWAETWAHYLHIDDALETARWRGLAAAEPGGAHEVAGGFGGGPPLSALDTAGFDLAVNEFISLAMSLNDVNASLGYGMFYPFELTPTVLDKLRFVHQVVAAARRPAVGR